MKPDCIVAVGCSFVAGSNITDKNGKSVGKEFTFSRIIANKLNIPEFNLAHPGSGNDRILDTLVDWVEDNKQFTSPFIVIGLSGITRKLFYSTYSNLKIDLHLFDIITSDYEALLKKSLVLTKNEDNVEKLQNFAEFYSKYLFNLEFEKTNLQRKLKLVVNLLDSKKYSYIVLNSFQDNIKRISKTINFLSFEQGETPTRLKPNDSPELYGSKNEDTWNHYLTYLHCREFQSFDPQYRSNKPKYGKYYCGGHPSPYANKIVARTLLDVIDQYPVSVPTTFSVKLQYTPEEYESTTD